MLRNAIWNVIAGMAGAVLSVALPPFLSRVLNPETFGAWAFCLQVAAYINILNLGLQMVVARFVASAEAVGDRSARDQAVAGALAILCIAGLIGLTVLWVLAHRLDLFVPAASPELRSQMFRTLLLLGGSFALLLPASVFGAVFIGLERNAIYAVGVIAGRTLTFVTVLTAGFVYRQLLPLGIAWLMATLVGVIVLFVLWRRYCPEPRLSPSLVIYPVLKELLHDGAGLMIWNIAMLLISGLQLMIVARVDYHALGAFSIASSLSLFVAGLMQAIASTTVPVSAGIIARNELPALGRLLMRTAIFTGVLSSLASIPLAVLSTFIMRLWAGAAYVDGAGLILMLLVLAQATRNTTLAYTMFAVGSGRQKRMMVTPLIEGVTTFASGLILGQRFGAAGVAAGMLVGGAVGSGLILGQHVLRDLVPGVRRRDYMLNAMLPPLLPLFAAAILLLLLLEGADLPLPLAAALALALGIGWISLLLASNADVRQLIVERLRMLFRQTKAA